MYKWVEIDLDAIAANYQKVRKFVRKETKILGVVKADAYGHGAVEVAGELERQGIDYLGVTELDEGIKLRRAGIKTPILVFGPFLPEDTYCLKEFDLTISINNLEFLKFLAEKAIPLKAHLKLETGFGRTGLKYDQLAETADILKKNDFLNIEGAYSHLSTAMWDNSSYVKKQYEEFNRAVSFLEEKGISLPIKHICNSAALSKFPQMHLDMVRVGNLLYGQQVGGKNIFQEEFLNAWYLKSQIIYINELPKGHPIGYEQTHILKKDTKIAIIPVGYVHGFSVEPLLKPKGIINLFKVLGKNILRFFNHPRVQIYGEIKGVKVPVLGKVGMQLTILDVSHIPQVQIGDTVLLPGRRTNISVSLPKVFLKGGKPLKVRSIQEKYEQVTLAAK